MMHLVLLGILLVTLGLLGYVSWQCYEIRCLLTKKGTEAGPVPTRPHQLAGTVVVVDDHELAARERADRQARIHARAEGRRV